VQNSAPAVRKLQELFRTDLPKFFLTRRSLSRFLAVLSAFRFPQKTMDVSLIDGQAFAITALFLSERWSWVIPR
jgi:hypothetical protein